jgi:hypothetical protein
MAPFFLPVLPSLLPPPPREELSKTPRDPSEALLCPIRAKLRISYIDILILLIKIKPSNLLGNLRKI